MRRFLRTKSLDELLAKTTSLCTLLDGLEPHLHQRWNEGCTDAARLFADTAGQPDRGQGMRAAVGRGGRARTGQGRRHGPCGITAVSQIPQYIPNPSGMQRTKRALAEFRTASGGTRRTALDYPQTGC